MNHQPTGEDSAQKIASIDRTHDPSLIPKLGFCLLHFCSILLCGYIVLGTGTQTIGGWFGQNWMVNDPIRGQVLLGVASLYWVRHSVTLFYLLVRKVEWGEVFGLVVFMMIVEVGLCLLAAGAFRSQTVPLGVLDAVAGRRQ